MNPRPSRPVHARRLAALRAIDVRRCAALRAIRSFRGARGAARILSASGLSAVLLSLYAVEGRLHQVPEARRDAYIHLWSGALLRLLHVQVQVDPDRPSADRLLPGPSLVVCNHRSSIDIALTLNLFGGQLLARGDMAAWPGIGALATAAGTLYVDREDTRSGATAIRRLSKRLQEGRTVVVFPEGTTYPGDQVRPFHAGAFMAIARARGQVVPVGIAYAGDDAFFGDESFTAHVRRIAGLPGTRVAVAVGEAIAADGPKAGELRDRAQEAVQALVVKARRMVDR